jgi:hypothetical protein
MPSCFQWAPHAPPSGHSLDVDVFEQWHLLFLRLIVAVLYSYASKNDHDRNSRLPTATLFGEGLLGNLKASGDIPSAPDNAL